MAKRARAKAVVARVEKQEQAALAKATAGLKIKGQPIDGKKANAR